MDHNNNEFSDKDVGCSEEPCPLASNPKDSCDFTSLVARCKHTVEGKRNYMLEYPPENNIPGIMPNLSIITGSPGIKSIFGRSDQIVDKVRFDYQGTCVNGRPHCPSIEVQGLIVESGDTVELETKEKNQSGEGFVHFMKQIFIPIDVQSTKYDIVRRCCDDNGVIGTINAYPEAGWKGEVTVGYFHETHKDVGFNQHQGYKKLKVKGTWGIEGKIEAQEGHSSWEVINFSAKKEAGHYKDNPVMKHMLPFLEKCLGGFANFLGDMKGDTASLQIHWPKIALSGDMKNCESKDSNDLSLVGSIGLNFSPLIGATFSLNILNLILDLMAAKSGGILITLKKLKKKLEKDIPANSKAGINLKSGVYFDIQGDVSGGLTWTKETDQEWQTKGTVKAGVGIKIYGKIESEAKLKFKVIDVNAKGGVEVGAGGVSHDKMGIWGELVSKVDDKKPSILGPVEFTGCKIYYAYWATVSGGAMSSNSASTKKTGSSSPRGKAGKKSQKQWDKEFGKKKNQDLIVLQEPWSWPPEEETKSQADADKPKKPVQLNSGKL